MIAGGHATTTAMIADESALTRGDRWATDWRGDGRATGCAVIADQSATDTRRKAGATDWRDDRRRVRH